MTLKFPILAKYFSCRVEVNDQHKNYEGSTLAKSTVCLLNVRPDDYYFQRRVCLRATGHLHLTEVRAFAIFRV